MLKQVQHDDFQVRNDKLQVQNDELQVQNGDMQVCNDIERIATKFAISRNDRFKDSETS